MESKIVKLKKKNRSENWVQEDRELLKQLVKQRYAAIENKNTDTRSNQEKKKAWLDLEQKFNSLCEGHKRNVCQLKCQWVSIKVLARKSSKAVRQLSEISEDSKIAVSEASQEFNKEFYDNKVELKKEIIESFDESNVAKSETSEGNFPNDGFFAPEAISSPNRDYQHQVLTINNHKLCNDYLSGPIRTTTTSEESRHSFNVSVLTPNEAKNTFFSFAGNLRKKRKRSDNWVEEDKTLLKELIKERLAAIENKNTDTLTNHRKKKAWSYIEKRFNCLRRGETRNVYQLKSQWTVLKMLAKKEAAEQGIGFALSNALKQPAISQTHSTKKMKVAVDLELKNRAELHAIQMENERKRARNLDLEYEILLEKKLFYQRKLDDGRSSYPELDKGGALQISVQAFQVDYYPYHLAKSDRSHWAKYKEASVSPALWLKESLNAFREAVLNLSQPNRPSTHAPLERSTPNSPITLNASTLATQFASKPTVNTSSTGSSTPTQMASNAGSGASSGGSQYSHQHYHTQQYKTVLDNLAKLMSSCVILRIEDFQLYRVTTSGKKQMPKEFISGDKDRYSFPAEMPILHAEFTYFYYPGDFIFPLPPSKVFVHINPLQLHFDLCSILWLNSFALNLHESLLRTSIAAVSPSNSTTIGSPTTIGSHGSQSTTLKGSSKLSLYNEPENEPSLMYMDVKVEAIMPRIVIESSVDAKNQKDRPKMMQIQISRFALTNIREMGSSRADLAQALHSLQEGSLVFGTGFPSASGDMCIVTDRILSHVAATDVGTTVETAVNTNGSGVGGSNGGQRSSIPKSNSLQCMSRYAMWAEPRDVWCIKFDPVWIDFLGARSLGSNKSIPFVDAVPITLWLHAGSGAISSSQSHSNGASRKGSGDSNSTKTGSASIETNINRLDFANSNMKLPKNPFLDSEEDIHLDHKSQTSSQAAERTADFHAIAHISNLVSVQIDHYQLLFLLRLGEEFHEMSTFLSLDAERILKKQNTKKSLIFGCVIPQIEVTFVMPSPTPGKESSGGDAESVLPDSASLGDDLLINSTNITWPTPPLEQIKSNTFGSVETPSPITNEDAYDNGIYISNPNTHGYNVQIQSTSTVASSTTSQTSSTKPDTGVFTQSVTSSITKSYKSTRNSTSDATSITKEINSGLMSMKKGFSSFMTSIDSAITSRAPNDDMSDTFSIQSDISSDSENFAIVMGDDKTMDCIDVMFRLNPFTNDGTIKASPVEVASEVYEEPIKTNLSSPSEPSEASTWRRRDLVSMVTFRLTTVEVIRQQEGNNSALRVQVAAVQCDECGAIPWDELQNAHQANKTKFGARCKAWNLAPYNPESPPCIRLRLEETIKMPKDASNIRDKKTIQNWVCHHADIRASDISLDLSMSTVIGLADLAEDEVISTNILPLNVTVENVRINLIEDRPPVNITSPGPVPINLAFGRMHLKRDKTGLLHIQPIETNLSGAGMTNYPLTADMFKASLTNQREKERDRELLSLQLIMQQIKLDNDNLRKQLQTAKENSDTYRQKSKQETDVLRSYLKAAQDDISILLEEKKALLDTIRSLQLQVTSMSMSNKKNEGNNR